MYKSSKIVAAVGLLSGITAVGIAGSLWQGSLPSIAGPGGDTGVELDAKPANAAVPGTLDRQTSEALARDAMTAYLEDLQNDGVVSAEIRLGIAMAVVDQKQIEGASTLTWDDPYFQYQLGDPGPEVWVYIFDVPAPVEGDSVVGHVLLNAETGETIGIGHWGTWQR